MNKINLEIIDYIENADFDDNLKSLLINAIIFEFKNRDKGNNKYKSSYKRMINERVVD